MHSQSASSTPVRGPDRMCVRLHRTVPEVFAAETAGFLVNVLHDRRDGADAFQHVQLRSHVDGVHGVDVAAQTSRKLGVIGARVVPHARQQATGMLAAKALNQFSSQYPVAGSVHQQHALIVQPDAAVLGGEMQPRQDVCVVRQGRGCGGCVGRCGGLAHRCPSLQCPSTVEHLNHIGGWKL